MRSLLLKDNEYPVTFAGNGYSIGTATVNNDLISKSELIGVFSGINALLDYQAAHQAVAKQGKSSDGTGSFYHFKSYAEAVDIYRHKPSEITTFDASDTKILGGTESGNRLIYDVTGDSLDIGRYLDGEPECYGSLSNGNPRGKRVHLLVNLSWSARVDKSVINYRSQRILRLVDWLESQGVRCMVTAINSSETCHMELTVKEYSEPLQITDLAIIAHSDFLRRVIFRFDEYSDTWRSGYGSSYTLSEYMRSYGNALDSENPAELTVFCDGYDQDGTDITRFYDKLETELTAVLDNSVDRIMGKVL